MIRLDYVNEVPIVAAVRLDVDLCDEAAGLVGRRVDDALGPRAAVHVINLKIKNKIYLLSFIRKVIGNYKKKIAKK